MKRVRLLQSQFGSSRDRLERPVEKDSLSLVPDEKAKIYCYALFFNLGDEHGGEELCVSLAGRINDRLLKEKGLSMKFYRSHEVTKNSDGEEHSKYFIALLGMSENALRQWASIRKADNKLDPTRSVHFGRELQFPLAQQTLLPGEKKEDSTFGTRELNLDQWKDIYCAYNINTSVHEAIFEHYPIDPESAAFGISDPGPDSSPFSHSERLRLIYEKVVAPTNQFGCEIPIVELSRCNEHPLFALFPLHTKSCRRWFNENWLKKFTFKSLLSPPLNEIKDYFGVPIGYYFGFIQFYIWFLIPLSVLGCIYGVLKIQTGQSFPSGSGEVAVVVIICWSVIFVEMWKRRQAKLRLAWGMVNAKELAIQRETFVGQWSTNKVTGELTQIPNYKIYLFRLGVGMSGLFTFVSIVFVTYLFIFFIRYTQMTNGIKVCADSSYWLLEGECDIYRCVDSENGAECADEEDYVRRLPFDWKILLGVINGLQILIYDSLFTVVSSHITDWENHRTQAHFDNFIIFKLFAFKFVNSFISLFYLAYLQNNFERTGYTNDEIIETLGVQLFILFASSLFFQNLNELLGENLRKRLKACLWRCTGHTVETVDPKCLSPAEIERGLEDYKGTLYDTCEIVIHYGYVTLFVVAFPFVPLIALVSAIVETRLDGLKLVNYCRRPIPYSAPGLGTWVQALDFLSFIAIINNVLLCVVLTDWPSVILNKSDADPTTQEKTLLFLTVSGMLCVMVLLIKLCISDTPNSVRAKIQRQRYIEGILCRGQKLDLEVIECCNKLRTTSSSFRNLEEEESCWARFCYTPATEMRRDLLKKSFTADEMKACEGGMHINRKVENVIEMQRWQTLVNRNSLGTHLLGERTSLKEDDLRPVHSDEVFHSNPFTRSENQLKLNKIDSTNLVREKILPRTINLDNNPNGMQFFI